MTQEMKHTPGPWEWSGLQLLGDCSDDSCSPVLIAQGDPFDPSDADKALIAAAPEMYEALKMAHSALDRLMGDTDWPDPNAYEVQAAQMARAAILKAEGRQP